MGKINKAVVGFGIAAVFFINPGAFFHASNPHGQTQMYTLAHTHTRITSICMHVFTRTRARAHAHTHSLSLSLALSLSLPHTYAHAHAHAHAHAQPLSQEYRDRRDAGII